MTKTVRQQAASKEQPRSGQRPAIRKSTKKSANWIFPFEKKNFLLAGIGIGVIVLGYILMATGITEDAAIPDGKWNNFMAVQVAPVLLIIGYCVIIPLAIIKFFGAKKEEQAG